MNIRRLLGAVFRALLMMVLFYVVGILVMFLMITLGSTEEEIWVPGMRWLFNSRNFTNPFASAASTPQPLHPICLGVIYLFNAALFIYFTVEEYKTPWGVLKSCGYLK